MSLLAVPIGNKCERKLELSAVNVLLRNIIGIMVRASGDAEAVAQQQQFAREL